MAEQVAVNPPVAVEDTEASVTKVAEDTTRKKGKDDDDQEKNAGVYQVQTHHDVEEVKARLFAKPDLTAVTQEVSSIWGWVSSKSQVLKERANELAQQAAPLAEKLTENMKEFTEAAEAKRLELMEQMNMQADFKEKQQVQLPWEEPASKDFADAIRDRILELAKDDKTFLVPPPDAVGFKFDFEDPYNGALAMAVMETDSNLTNQRFKLVPKEISETNFWRNYFYRVSLIKEAYQVNNEEGQTTEGATRAMRKETEEDEEHHDDVLHGVKSDKPLEDDDINGWAQNTDDDGLNLNDEDDENFDMLDDDELLASAGLNLDDGDDVDLDDEDDDGLEERIKAELNLA